MNELQQPPFSRPVYDFASVQPGQVISDEVIAEAYGIPCPANGEAATQKVFARLALARISFGEAIARAVDFNCFIRYPQGLIHVLDSEGSSIAGEKKLRQFVRRYAKTLRTMCGIPLEQLSSERREQHEKIVQMHTKLEQARNRERRKITRDSRACDDTE